MEIPCKEYDLHEVGKYYIKVCKEIINKRTGEDKMKIYEGKNNKEFEYEMLPENTWLKGRIDEVQQRTNEHRKYKDKDTGEWKEKSAEELRFAFRFDDFEHRHYSRWMTESLNEKSNLYTKYIKKLSPQVTSSDRVDWDLLVDMEVDVMWENSEYNGKVYQNINLIKATNQPVDIRCFENGKEAKG